MDESLIRAVQYGRTEEVRSLLIEIVNLEKEFSYQYHGQSDFRRPTLLMVAADSPDSNLSVMKILIDAGAELDHSILRLGTALCRACSHGDSNRVKFLIDAGATAWPIKEIGRNFLLSAEEEESRVAQLMPWMPDEVGCQSAESIPLFMAARSGSADCVKLIIRAGFPAKFTNKYGTELVDAMNYATGEDVVSILLQEGLSDRRADNPYYDPLHEKLECEDYNGVRVLIESISMAERQGRLNHEFLLFCGYDFVSLRVLKFLVELGADPNHLDVEGLGSPLHWAVWQGGTDKIETSGAQIDLLNYLVSQGADINFAEPGGVTPLHDAVYGDWGNPTATKFLIDHGANVNAVDDEGRTPLILACDQGELPCVELLVGAGAKKDVVGKDGSTALSNAIKYLSRHEDQDDAVELAKARKIVELLQS